MDINFIHIQNIHTVYHKFCNYMKRWYFVKKQRHGFRLIKGKLKCIKTKREFKEIDLEKIVGYKASCRIERYAAKNPEIKIACCDDNQFMGSRIALIPHKSKKEFMGITMILIPQCKSPSNVVFLYPEHIESLLKAFKEIKKDLPINLEVK